MLHERFEAILAAPKSACVEHYGDRLVSAAVFGSVARGTMRPDSDIDLLLVVSGLPRGRMPRVGTFDAVESRLCVRTAKTAARCWSRSSHSLTCTQDGNADTACSP
jgi:hypothetical protein